MSEVVTSDNGGANAVALMRSFATTHDLRREAELCCRQSLRSAAEEGDLDGLSPEHVQVVFERCSLVFDHGELSYPFVETRFGLYVPDPTCFRDQRRVGHYRLITLLDGRVDDDYLVLEESS